jgi:tetratricopeptide (TPR) repeat protein
MARAATQKGKRAKQAPRPRQQSGNVGGSAKSIEQQLFFGRIRRQAKWVFALLAVVFAGSFVFLGVGSGNTGIGDLFRGNFHLFGGGSSGPSVNGLQKKVAENPRNLQDNLDLAQALVRAKRTKEAIPVVERYLRLEPRNQEAIGQLAALYERRARVLEAELRLASNTSVTLVDPAEFAPGGKIGTALAAYPDAIIRTLQARGALRQDALLPELQQSRRGALSAYQRIAALTPDDPGALEQVGISALQVCSTVTSGACPELQTASLTFQSYLAKFPDAADAPQVKQQIKSIQKQLRANPSVASTLQG